MKNIRLNDVLLNSHTWFQIMIFCKRFLTKNSGIADIQIFKKLLRYFFQLTIKKRTHSWVFV
jgi:hypothetical protein